MTMSMSMLDRLRRRRIRRKMRRETAGRARQAAGGRDAAVPSARRPEWSEYAFGDRMATVEFRVTDEPHIVVDTAACRGCPGQPCVTACPADLFTPTADGGILFSHDQCFECGLCRLVCESAGADAITWSYPLGGHGVVLRWS
ncbi:ferredoxin family protein [Marinactinospora rubrisoli]|uniref:Ferredoxin family protein n=1 Tax=Marinactinospora rubrisoli TaxID=2715399 RepID=A0ABW2KKD4_9ACTN